MSIFVHQNLQVIIASAYYCSHICNNSERPLVPYMRFSRKMWPKVRNENPDSPLWDIGKMIGQLWRDAPDNEKAVYQQDYEAEKV